MGYLVCVDHATSLEKFVKCTSSSSHRAPPQHGLLVHGRFRNAFSRGDDFFSLMTAWSGCVTVGLVSRTRQIIASQGGRALAQITNRVL